MSYKKYEELFKRMQPVSKEEHKTLVKKCQENTWLKLRGAPFEDDPFLEPDSPYTFQYVESLKDLYMFFEHGNWSIRQGVIYKDLIFINQVNGGCEWWTLKKFNSEIISFESCTFNGYHGMRPFSEFKHDIECMLKATKDECINLNWRT